MKKFLIVMAALFALYYAHKYLDERGFRKESQSFVDGALTNIAANWSLDVFKKYVDAKLGAGKDVEKVLANYRKLGKLTHAPDCTIQDSTSYQYPGTAATYKALTYQCEASFENAPATMQLIIYRFQDKSEWKIMYFTLNSLFFAPVPKK